MAKRTFIIKPDLSNWQEMGAFVKRIHESGNAATVTVEEGEKKRRSLPANALQAVWYKQIADNFGHSVEHVACDMKIRFGINIVAGSDDIRGEMIRATLDKIGYQWLSFSDKINVVKDLPVTRIMTKTEHKQMLDMIQEFYARHGLVLDSKGED